MKIQDYYLNLDKINKLDKFNRKIIHEYYRDMIFNVGDDRKITEAIFNTLIKNEFLISIREEKIDEIIDGDKTVNN